MNKKIILMIVLFIGAGLIVYSFANPIEQEMGETLEEPSVEENVNSDSFNDNDKEDTIVEEEQDKENEFVEETPIEDVVEKPEQGNNSANSTPNNNSNNNSNNVQRPSVDATPEPVEPSTPEVVVPEPVYATLEVEQSSGDSVTIEQTENDFVLGGSMEEKPIINGLKTGYYVKLKITAPKVYTNEELEKMNVTLLYNGVTYTQAEHQVLDGLDENQKAYFYLTQEFMYGKSISILVDWGDNNPITYTFTFNINVENEDTTV